MGLPDAVRGKFHCPGWRDNFIALPGDGVGDQTVSHGFRGLDKAPGILILVQIGDFAINHADRVFFGCN